MGTEMIITLLGAISGLGGLTWIGSIVYRKQNKRLKDAEVRAAELANEKEQLELKAAELANLKNQLELKTAEFELDKMQREADAQRIEQLHEALNANNATITQMSETISMLNKTIDNKTLRIREVEDRLVITERENTRLAEENGELKEDNANHRCVIKKCGARDPQNEHTCAALRDGTAVFPTPPMKKNVKRKKADKEV